MHLVQGDVQWTTSGTLASFLHQGFQDRLIVAGCVYLPWRYWREGVHSGSHPELHGPLGTGISPLLSFLLLFDYNRQFGNSWWLVSMVSLASPPLCSTYRAGTARLLRLATLGVGLPCNYDHLHYDWCLGNRWVSSSLGEYVRMYILKGWQIVMWVGCIDHTPIHIKKTDVPGTQYRHSADMVQVLRGSLRSISTRIHKFVRFA